MTYRAATAPRALWREILVVLVGKSAALALIYLLFFSDTSLMPPPADHIFQAQPSKSGEAR